MIERKWYYLRFEGMTRGICQKIKIQLFVLLRKNIIGHGKFKFRNE